MAGQGDIGLHLCRRITQPECLDIAGDDEGVGLAVAGAGGDGGVQRVRIAVFKQPSQFRVSNLGFDVYQMLFHRSTDKAALCLGWAAADEVGG